MNKSYACFLVALQLLFWVETNRANVGTATLKYRIPFKQLHRFTYPEPFDDPDVHCVTVAEFPHYREACPWPCSPARRGLYGDHNLATQSNHSRCFSWWIQAKVQFVLTSKIDTDVKPSEAEYTWQQAADPAPSTPGALTTGRCRLWFISSPACERLFPRGFQL